MKTSSQCYKTTFPGLWKPRQEDHKSEASFRCLVTGRITKVNLKTIGRKEIHFKNKFGFVLK